jgi:hypothetical protein
MMFLMLHMMGVGRQAAGHEQEKEKIETFWIADIGLNDLWEFRSLGSLSQPGYIRDRMRGSRGIQEAK